MAWWSGYTSVPRLLLLLMLLTGTIIGVMGYAVADILMNPARAGSSGGMLDDLWSAAKAAGIFGTLFMLWQFLRVDGRLQERDNERVALFREVVGLVATATSAINTVNSGAAAQMSTMQAVQQSLLRVEGLLAKIERGP